MSKQQDPSCVTVQATITNVQERYVVALPVRDYGDLQRNESITFSRECWQGTPEELFYGAGVALENTSLHRQGWRALEARPISLARGRKGVRS